MLYTVRVWSILSVPPCTNETVHKEEQDKEPGCIGRAC